METKLTIPDPMNDYTVIKNLLFFEADERVSLEDLCKVFTLPAVAELIANDLVLRDCHVIKPKEDKMVSKQGQYRQASNDLIEWVDVEFIQMHGDKHQCRILANNYIVHFKFTK